MAKFKYRMQSVLNIKEKLEEQAKNDFAAARIRLNEEEEKLNALKMRKAKYEEEAILMREGTINIQDLTDNKYALERMEEYIDRQIVEVNKASSFLESARIKMTEAMQEAQIHNRLKEKAFEEFKKDLIAQESKEIDELTSYTYGQHKNEV